MEEYNLKDYMEYKQYIMKYKKDYTNECNKLYSNHSNNSTNEQNNAYKRSRYYHNKIYLICINCNRKVLECNIKNHYKTKICKLSSGKK